MIMILSVFGRARGAKLSVQRGGRVLHIKNSKFESCTTYVVEQFLIYATGPDTPTTSVFIIFRNYVLTEK